MCMHGILGFGWEAVWCGTDIASAHNSSLSGYHSRHSANHPNSGHVWPSSKQLGHLWLSSSSSAKYYVKRHEKQHVLGCFNFVNLPQAEQTGDWRACFPALNNPILNLPKPKLLLVADGSEHARTWAVDSAVGPFYDQAAWRTFSSAVWEGWGWKRKRQEKDEGLVCEKWRDSLCCILGILPLGRHGETIPSSEGWAVSYNNPNPK